MRYGRGVMRRTLAVAFTLSATVAAAQEGSQPLVLHGFGSAGYGKNGTDNNHYDSSDPRGDYRHAIFSLSVAAAPMERLRIRGQVMHVETDEEGEPVAELDFAFGEWRFSDALRLRAGQIQQPFGIYNEIFDVGTLRPFSFLPKGIYDSGILAEGLNGVGVAGSRRIGSGWGLQYDVYLGGLQVEDEPLNETIGGRVVLETPVTGLSFGASGYSGSAEDSRHSVLGAHGEYLAGAWSMRAEYVHAWLHGDVKVDTAYAEVARRLGGNLQAAARYDWSEQSHPDMARTSADEHKDVGLGMNYWFSPNFVTKLSYHHVDGNLFAGPEDGSPALESTTDAVFVTAQLSF